MHLAASIVTVLPVRKLPVTLGYSVVSCQVLQFPPPLTTQASHNLATLWQKK